MQRRISTAVKRASLMAAIVLPIGLQFLSYPVMNDWRDSKALREELGQLVAEAEAIAKLAQDEKRELTDEEAKRVDAILGVGEEGKPGFQAGLVHAKKAQIARMERIENSRDHIANEINGGGAGNGTQRPNGRQLAQTDDEGTRSEDGLLARVRVPASCARPNLQACRIHASREMNERTAYAAGRFFMATVGRHQASMQWCQEVGLISNTMTVGTDADGGFTVPTELSQVVEYWRDRYGVFRREASYERMSSDTKDVAVQTGGLPFTFVAEGAAPATTSKLAFKNVSLVAKRVSTIARMTSELAEDSIIDIGEAVVMAIGEAFAKAEDYCGFLGDGTSTYGSMTGIIPLIDANTPLKGLYIPEGVSALEDLTNAHMRKIISLIPGKYREGCKWYCNSTVYDAVMAPILDAAGGNAQSDLEQGPGRLRFKGYDVVESQILPDAESIDPEENVLIFGNLRAGAKFGDRRMMTISRSTEVFWTTDEIAIKGTQRFQTKIHEPGTTTAVGAFVVLQLAAAS